MWISEAEKKKKKKTDRHPRRRCTAIYATPMGHTHTLTQLQKPACSLRCIWSQQGEQPIYLMSLVQVCVPMCGSFVGQSVVKTNLCRFPQVTLEQPLIGHTHIHLHARTHTHTNTHTHTSIYPMERLWLYSGSGKFTGYWAEAPLPTFAEVLRELDENKNHSHLMIKIRTVCGWVGKPRRTN